MIKAIFFDAGDVLFRADFAGPVREFEEKHGIVPGRLYVSVHDRPYWREFTLGNISEQDYFQKVAGDFGAGFDIEELKNAIYESFMVNEELIDYIRTLKNQHILGIISNNPKEWFDRFWHGQNWKEIFEVHAVSGYLHVRKPDPRIYQHALKTAKIKGEEAVYVDNRADRTEGAVRLGMKILIYKNIEQLKKAIDNLERGAI